MSGITAIIRGINGELELNRVAGALGHLTFIVSVPAFTAWSIHLHGEFDITAYCLAFGGGLATLFGGNALATAVKDRNVASAKVIEATGSKPATPPAPAPTPQPEIAEAGEELPDYAR